ncbi:MAG: sugar kinase [Mycobacteriales bacterium]
MDVVTFGETMAALRADGPIRLGGTARWSVAGAEANVAIGLARLGHAVRWVGRVGADEPGALVLRTLRAENVDVTHAATDPGAPTGLILFEPRLVGVVRVGYYRTGSAGGRLTEAEVLKALNPLPRVLHVTGITPALGPEPRAAVGAAVAAARDAGVTVCFDVNYRSRLWPAAEAARVLRPLATAADIVVASADELALVAPDGPAGLLAAGVAEVVVTRGADGAEAVTAAGTLAVPAREVTLVDPVGAGDAFVAGYLSALLDGLDVDGRLARAVTTGAFAATTPGDWEGLPTRDELPLLGEPPGTTLR